ncbi:MAG: hypothetical protein JWR80_2892 [Bradyrhizobium sp.]|nr:hypothetical protein [Bradyrhizobium sp.]
MTKEGNAALGRLTTVIVILFAGLMAVTGQAAPASPSELTLSQSSVTIETGSSTSVLISVRDPSHGTHLRFDGDPGIKAAIKAQGAGHWLVSLSTDARLTSEGLLTIELRDRANKTVAITQLKVVAKARPLAETFVQAAILLDGDTLVEGPKLQGFLTITNRGEQALSIGQLRPVAPKEICLDLGPAPGLIMPRQTIVRPFTVSVLDDTASPPGKHMIGVAIPVTSDLNADEARRATNAIGPRGWSGEVVATKDLTLTVPGVSALEGVLQIPSLLLLPGLLAVASFSAILNAAKPRVIGEDPLSRLAILLSPGLWIVMILISGAIGLLYVLISGRNILYAYALRDLVWLSFPAIVIGGLVGWGAYAREKRRQANAAAPRFAAGLSPIALLGQLTKEGTPWRLPAKLVDTSQLFALEPVAGGQQVWACGRIDWRFAGTHDNQVATKVRQAVVAQDVKALADHQTNGEITLTFAAFHTNAASVTSPRLVSSDLFKGTMTEDALVQEAS